MHIVCHNISAPPHPEARRPIPMRGGSRPDHRCRRQTLCRNLEVALVPRARTDPKTARPNGVVRGMAGRLRLPRCRGSHREPHEWWHNEGTRQVLAVRSGLRRFCYGMGIRTQKPLSPKGPAEGGALVEGLLCPYPYSRDFSDRTGPPKPASPPPTPPPLILQAEQPTSPPLPAVVVLPVARPLGLPVDQR